MLVADVGSQMLAIFSLYPSIFINHQYIVQIVGYIHLYIYIDTHIYIPMTFLTIMNIPIVGFGLTSVSMLKMYILHMKCIPIVSYISISIYFIQHMCIYIYVKIYT